jgi:hypothetical protein
VYHESAAITRPRRIIGKSFSFVQKEWFSARFQGRNLDFVEHSKKPCTANAVQGFLNYRIPYAERNVSDSYNAGPHEFNSSFSEQYVRQLGSRPCRAE